VPQARRAGLLARLRAVLAERGLLERVPEAVRAHLDADWTLAERHAASVRWEVNRIQEALVPAGVPIILLKGAAYVMAELPPARGRLFHDVDIMVPKGALDDAERALVRHRWRTTHLDPYDQKYYRKWMHELPPMQHARRKTVLDVHHNILPETARLRPDAARLLEAAEPLAGHEELYVLAPADMVLHSATHLFHDGELEQGLRDLVDLDALLRHFGAGPGFWPRLLERAGALDLGRPLHYALRYAARLLATPVPAEALAAAREAGPPRALEPLLDALFLRGLAPPHEDCDDALSGAARWLLYVRSHYLRMPPHLLVPHLARKALRGGDS